MSLDKQSEYGSSTVTPETGKSSGGDSLSYETLFKRWGIPDPTKTKLFSDLQSSVTTGLGPGYEYDAVFGTARGAAEKGFAERTGQMHKLDTTWGNTINLGAANRIDAISRAKTASQVGSALMKAQSENVGARAGARKSLLNVLMSHQSTIANVLGSYEDMETQKSLTEMELKSQEDSGGSFIVGAEYGMTSLEERLVLIWKRLMLKLAYKKGFKRKFWRAVFSGYHRAAPWVVEKTEGHNFLLKLQKKLVDNFIDYTVVDVTRFRKKRVQEFVAAYTMLLISLLGWRFGNGIR